MDRRRIDRGRGVAAVKQFARVCLVFVALIALAALIYREAIAGPALPDPVAQVRIPPASATYRIRLEREAGALFGLKAPIARFAGQIHTESGWEPEAESPYAQGLSQFTPATARWLPDVCPSVGEPDPWDPNWSIRAMVCYDHYLWSRAPGATACDRWAFALSAYNGGEGWTRRDRTLASAKGADSARWFGHVELHTSRARWARDENRAYVRRILLVLEPAYIAAGWPGVAVCP